MASSTSPSFDLSSGDSVLELRLPRSPLGIEKAEKDRGPIGSMLDSAEKWMSFKLNDIDDPGVWLKLGLPLDADLHYGHKLHLYAIALADRAKAATGVQFKSVKVTKRHDASTTLYVGSASQAQDPTDLSAVTLITRRSYAKPGFSQAIREETRHIHDVAAEGAPLRLNISYVTGLPRTWSRLWGPTIAGILGARNRDDAVRLSSNIVDLSFDHYSIGEPFEHQVQLTISASRVTL